MSFTDNNLLALRRIVAVFLSSDCSDLASNSQLRCQLGSSMVVHSYLHRDDFAHYGVRKET